LHTGIYNNKTKHMKKTKTSAENQPMPSPSSFHHHIIGLIRSPMLECFLYTLCSSKDQNNVPNRKRRERRPADRICRLCHTLGRGPAPHGGLHVVLSLYILAKHGPSREGVPLGRRGVPAARSACHRWGHYAVGRGSH